MSLVSVLNLPGLVVVKICFICERGSHMAASAQHAGLDMPAISSGIPNHHIKASSSQLGTCMTRQLFNILNECMHSFEATAASSLLMQPMLLWDE